MKVIFSFSCYTKKVLLQCFYKERHCQIHLKKGIRHLIIFASIKSRHCSRIFSTNNNKNTTHADFVGIKLCVFVKVTKFSARSKEGDTCNDCKKTQRKFSDVTEWEGCD